ncbi:MAG: response regulator [bacterium]
MVQRLYGIRSNLGEVNVHGKILIACRDESCRKSLLNLFAGQDCSVTAVPDETDLLLEILERDYDVLIYDLENSALNGLKGVKIIKKIRPKLALVVISNNPSKELGGRILQEGVIYYDVKPIHAEAMKRAVSNRLTNR